MLRLILAACLLPAALVAQEPIAAKRQFLPIDEAQEWSGVGRLNARGGFCTGALIAPDKVLTAAHCIFDRRTGAPIPLTEMRFVAGSRKGYHTANRRISAARAHPEWSGYQGESVRVRGDIAVVTLESPLSTIEGRAYRTGDAPEVGDDVLLLSYGRDRETALSIQAPCQVIERYRKSAALNCDVTYGASGSPVFEDGQIVGVISAMSGVGDDKVALAVMVDGAIDDLVAEAASAAASPTTTAAPESASAPGASAKDSLTSRFRSTPKGGSRLPGGKRPPSQ